ncbi:MAG: arginine deiminase-related protein, partial [Brachybacterium sp.]|nr:arginine deiminase-related protein [Brachybacterium sp.]
MTPQSPGAVVLVRPGRFLPNPLTARDNAFQRRADRGPDQIAEDAYREVTEAAWMLSSAGVTVHLFDDAEATRPDAVFPNNWFSTHPDGRIALYPMYAPNRRTERRSDIIDLLKHRYRVQHVLDYSGVEHDEVFLEGTGAMVLDHAARLAFTARSRRADPALLERFCADFGYTPVLFDAVGP